MLINGKPGNLISIRDRGLLYGDGIFRTLRCSKGQPQQWLQHYQKLLNDCTKIGIPCPEFATLSLELDELIASQPDSIVKLVVTRGIGARGYSFGSNVNPTHFWDIFPLPEYPHAWANQGIKVKICKLHLSHQPRLAGVKHLNRLENVLAAGELNDEDIAEGLLMDVEGNVIECTRSNLFIVKKGMLITPDLSRCGVAGLQRDRVLTWARQNAIPLKIRDINLDEVLQSDELFVVNSIIGLWPICQLECSSWGDFPVSRWIQLSLFGAMNMNVSDRRNLDLS